MGINKVNNEIERRWLLKSLPDIKLDYFEKSEIAQFYISKNPVLRLRNHDNKKFVFCVKTKGTPGVLGNPEQEMSISKKEFVSLQKHVTTFPIQKTRHYIKIKNGLIAELDVFKGKNKGLIIVEVEFKNIKAAQKFVAPSWFGKKEITGMKKYANSYLAKNL